VFARDNSNIVRLECTPPKEDAELALGRVLVKSTSAEMGDNEGHLDASIQGEEMQIAFNGRYLRDALEAIESQQVLLQITGPSSPGIIKPVGEPNGYLHVIMPMHVAR
jgi:DNA polymerase III subunit beta